MGRPLNKGPLSEAQWLALRSRIQSHSPQLESEQAKASTSLIEALAGLEELEALTRTHLTPAPPAFTPAPTQQPKVITPPSAHASPAASAKYKTAHQEYAPALKQDQLVEALLQYQRRKMTRSSSSVIPARGAKTTQARSDFSQMTFPEVSAEPKSSTLSGSRVPGVRIPVLRSKFEGKP